MTDIKCPKCGTIGKFSLAQPVFQGPYKCWKCRELFNIRIENNVLKSCEPLSQEDFAKLQELEKMRAKFRGGQ